ncbi:hypothetical protein PV11_00250 [Exophiala sideris]|uniref:Uncharacterized protein n=1 Tax=Exophiala sideris TaxID=1016849 RepID=A0A0D1YSR5_9EURO|nr:hypothetical protein PV11_00250 [Exophiala sideris]
MTVPAEIHEISSLDQADMSRRIINIPKGVSKAAVAFNGVGCKHTHMDGSLPAVIMDALRNLYRPWNDPRKYHSLLVHCKHCATDLRVKAAAEDAHHIKIKVDLWHCLGGRELGRRLLSEDSFFDPYRFGDFTPVDMSTSPNRDLERLYNADFTDRKLRAICSRWILIFFMLVVNGMVMDAYQVLAGHVILSRILGDDHGTSSLDGRRVFLSGKKNFTTPSFNP